MLFIELTKITPRSIQAVYVEVFKFVNVERGLKSITGRKEEMGSSLILTHDLMYQNISPIFPRQQHRVLGRSLSPLRDHY